MSSQSNTKLLKQLTTRKRDPSKNSNTKGAKSNNKAKNAEEEAKQANPAIKYIKESTPEWMKKPQAKTAFDVALFGVCALVIIKFGKTMATTLDENCPTEKSIMDMMNQ